MHDILKSKPTLVSGVSSGIGREISQLLAEPGARVFGTVRNPQSAKPIHETLDHEVRRFGVRAVLVEPAYTKTKINSNAKAAKLTLDVYAAERKGAAEVTERETERGDDPRVVAKAVWNAVTATSPPLRYPIGKGVTLSRLRRFVPAVMFDRSFRKQFQLD